MNNQPHWVYLYITPFLPTALTIAGWFFIVSREKSKRCLERKDRRIDAALALLEKIEADALRYYTVDDADNVLASAIKHNLKWLAKLCARINGNLKVTELRTVTTGGDFESKKRMLLKPDHVKFIQIRDVVFKLRDELEGCHDD